MGYHSRPERRRAAEHWQRFAAGQARYFDQTGLPFSVIEDISNWDDFLSLGYLPEQGPTPFDPNSLSETGYASLLKMVEAYFQAGYAYSEPAVIKTEDRQRLRQRFGKA